MTRIILNVDEAQRLARGALAAAEKRDFTPIITGGLLSVDSDGVVKLVATDRYRVHRMFTNSFVDRTTEKGLQRQHEAGEVVLPHDALKWLSANARKLGNASSVVIDFEPYAPSKPRENITEELGRIRIEVRAGLLTTTDLTGIDDADGLLAYACRPIKGSYPPVDRMFDSLEPAQAAEDALTTVNVDFLADLAVLKRGKYQNNTKIRHSKTSPIGKKAPIRFEFWDNDAGRKYADAIIQPVIDLR